MDTSTSRVAPEEFMCPLSHQFMTDPVVSVHGETFQREAILTWLEMDGDYCPFSGKPMSRGDLIPNFALRTRIHAWTEQNGSTPPSGDSSVEDEERAYMRKLGISDEIEIDCDKFKKSMATPGDSLSIDETIKTVSSTEKFPILEIDTSKKSRRISGFPKALFKFGSHSA